ncbi:MAG: energy transducer TonB, partial [Acidobacteriota bacterium]|nr:energy transducer TonB [Acidobacteriota bacterium]
RVSGSVLVRLVVSPEGTPTQMTVLRPLGYGLDENALAAVSGWKFQPGVKEGKPVAVRAIIEVNYRPLDKSGDPGWHAGPLTFHLASQTSRPVVSQYVAPKIDAYTGPENAFLELEFEVDESGRPNTVRVTKPSATEVDEAVRAAVAQWRFEPALLDGKPVMVSGRLQYVHGTAPPAPVRTPPPPVR